MLVDSHCHLDFPDLAGQLPDLLTAMRANDVRAAVCVGVNLEAFPGLLALISPYDHLYATVGVHPEYDQVEEPDTARLAALAAHDKVIAIGETGLDYHWHQDRPAWQQLRFRTHIQAARAVAKPLVIHSREAAEDTLAIYREEGGDAVGAVLHCFTGDWATARRALDQGLYLSFSGIVTFKKAIELREVAEKAPLDRILVETDAPYLAPVPYRGKTNQPAYVRHVAEEIARLRHTEITQIEAATTDNFYRLFACARCP